MSRREKLIESARPYPEGDEDVRCVVSGQTGAPQARHEIGSVPVAYRGRVLTIGDERTWVHPFAQGDAQQIGSLTAR